MPTPVIRTDPRRNRVEQILPTNEVDLADFKVGNIPVAYGRFYSYLCGRVVWGWKLQQWGWVAHCDCGCSADLMYEDEMCAVKPKRAKKPKINNSHHRA